MDDPNKILAQIKPCDTNKPYIFVSYSSSDRDVVWTDVLRFQQNGYNVWLDEKNLDKTKDSWKQDALRAINNRRCRLLLFYVSATSLCSEPCLGELQETFSEKTCTNHLDPVPYVAVDVEEIGNIISFCNQIHMRLEDEIEDNDEFERKAEVLKEFKEAFFNGNNDRVRVHPRNEPGRKGDYYEDIQNSFPDKTRLTVPEVVPPVPGPEPVPGGEDGSGGESTTGSGQETGGHESGPDTTGEGGEGGGKKRKSSNTGDITYTLYGEEYTENQSGMMFRFFQEVLSRHPEQVKSLPEQQGMNCASLINYEDPANRDPETMPSYFRVPRYLTFPNGEAVCIGSAYNNTDKLKKMARLLSICGEDPSIFSSEQVELPDLSAPRRKGGRPRKSDNPDSAG